MSLKIEDMDVTMEIATLNYHMMRLQFIVQKIIDLNGSELKSPTIKDIEDAEKESMKLLKVKFPGLEISTK
jgi:hypothetical protein